MAHFESDDSRQGICRDAMPHRITEARQQEYPEAAITTTAATDRRAASHCKNIPEAWLE